MLNISCLILLLQTGEKSGQVEKSKKNARQRQNDFKVGAIVTVLLAAVFKLNTP